ncbi:hypothetical protein IF650_09085 [Cellulosimicrobium terreum]|nr:hypothetical protein [Cellulosimicrobium terreum]
MTTALRTPRPDPLLRPPSGGPAPVTAARLRRPTWRDPRLLIGVVIVAVSVALGSWAVGAAGRTTPVYAVTSVALPGDAISLADLHVVDVQLGAAGEKYLRADADLPDGMVVLRAVAAGELLPTAALGSAEELEVRSVAVPVTTGLSDRITPGTQVDLWYVPPVDGSGGDDDDDTPAEPVQLVENVTVAQVDEGASTLVVGGTVTVHTLVPVADLPGVLGAVAGAGNIAVVPRGGA